MNDCKLIELVKENPCLYNTKNRQYKDANLRESAWKNISESLKYPADECKSRWKSIRATFSRNRRFEKQSNAATLPKKRKWFLLDKLRFLDQLEKGNLSNSTSVKEDSSSEETENTETYESEVIVETVAEKDCEKIQSPHKRKQPSIKLVDNISKRCQNVVEERSKSLTCDSTKQPEDDHIDLFFKSIAMSVKKLSPENQVQAKSQICQFVCQLELQEMT